MKRTPRGSITSWRLIASLTTVALAWLVTPVPAVAQNASTLTLLTSRPVTGDTVDWGQLGTPNLTITTPQNFTSTGGTTGTVDLNGTGFLVEQCCIGIVGTFDGDFAPGNIVLATHQAPLTINFNTPVQSGAYKSKTIVSEITS